MPDEEAIRREHDLLATAMHYYSCHTGTKLTTQWKEAMLGLPHLFCENWPADCTNLRPSLTRLIES